MPIIVYSIAAAAQTVVLTAIVVIGKGAPIRGAVILGNPTLELYVTLAATAVVGAIMGLVLSASATSQDQILPMLVVRSRSYPLSGSSETPRSMVPWLV